MRSETSGALHVRLGVFFLLRSLAIYRVVAGMGGGGGGVHLSPSSKLMIFMTIVMPWKNIEGRNVRTV